jgi:hypothetical protein
MTAVAVSVVVLGVVLVIWKSIESLGIVAGTKPARASLDREVAFLCIDAMFVVAGLSIDDCWPIALGVGLMGLGSVAIIATTFWRWDRNNGNAA